MPTPASPFIASLSGQFIQSPFMLAWVFQFIADDRDVAAVVVYLKDTEILDGLRQMQTDVPRMALNEPGTFEAITHKDVILADDLASRGKEKLIAIVGCSPPK